MLALLELVIAEDGSVALDFDDEIISGSCIVRDGEIAEIGTPGSIEAPAGAQIVDAEGKHLFPAFVDPHVHLRSPGQEHKEDLETGTRAAAAGGYCAVVAMPNTPHPRMSSPGPQTAAACCTAFTLNTRADPVISPVATKTLTSVLTCFGNSNLAIPCSGA